MRSVADALPDDRLFCGAGGKSRGFRGFNVLKMKNIFSLIATSEYQSEDLLLEC